jgi:hypothetical protein
MLYFSVHTPPPHTQPVVTQHPNEGVLTASPGLLLHLGASCGKFCSKIKLLSQYYPWDGEQVQPHPAPQQHTSED